MFNMCQWQYEYEQDCHGHGMYSQHNIKYRPKWKKLPISLHPVWSWERYLDNYYRIYAHVKFGQSRNKIYNENI